MLKKASLILYALLVTVVVGWKLADIERACLSDGEIVPVHLARGDFNVLLFPSLERETRAIILYGSGDGGWGEFDETISQTLQNHGYEVVGIDFNVYARTDYSLPILQSDFGRIAEKFSARLGDQPPPLIVGGWSMGAAQAIAAAGGPHPPPRLAGLLLVDPCARGRYGLRLSDQADILPTGPGTFSVEDFAGAMSDLRIAQWHAEHDSIDSTAWLGTLPGPHHEFDFAPAGHSYSVDRDVFLHQLAEVTVPWILSQVRTATTSTGDKP